MKAVKHPGICQICGQLKELTAEHIPPQKAFNSSSATIYPFKEVTKILTGTDGRMPWDTQGLKGVPQQGGYKRYCLCQPCNNNTGQWYMRTYSDFVNTIHNMIHEENLAAGNSYSFTIQNFYPLRLYKAMMTMMCDINNNCFGDDNLRQFILTKESNTLDTQRYSLHMFLVSPSITRIKGGAGLFIARNDFVIVSEVASYPLGFALYLDKPSTYVPFGLNVNNLLTAGYYDQMDVLFHEVPFVELNSHLPVDYRTREQIVDDMQYCQKRK